MIKLNKFYYEKSKPIVSDKEWENDNPQAIFLFAWNHRKEIEKKYGFSRDMQVLTHLRSDIESSM